MLVSNYTIRFAGALRGQLKYRAIRHVHKDFVSVVKYRERRFAASKVECLHTDISNAHAVTELLQAQPTLTVPVELRSWTYQLLFTHPLKPSLSGLSSTINSLQSSQSKTEFSTVVQCSCKYTLCHSNMTCTALFNSSTVKVFWTRFSWLHIL